MKKFYSRFLIAATVSMFAATASADDTLYEIDGINYGILTDSTAYLEEAVSTTSVGGNLVIPQSVTINGKSYTLTRIESTAFKDCIDITSVTLPSTIDYIGLQAFNGCSSMKSINLQDTKIDELKVSTFLYCRSLETITIPATVTTIGLNPFMETLAMKSINVAEGNTAFTSIDGVLFTADKKELISFPSGHSKNYTIPEGTEIIANSAFCMARGLKNVTFPASLTTIDGSAFLRCDSLQKIVLPTSGNLTYIGASAFAECKQATGDIVVPSNIKTLGQKAFYYTSITSLEIPGVSTINGSVAQNCVKLRKITLSEGTKFISASAFATTAISEIVIPNSVTTMKSCVFEGCTLLGKVTLGSGLKTIETRVFYNLKRITEINCNAVTPPTIADYASYPSFTAEVYAAASLNVPAESVDVYKEATTWKNFAKITAGVNDVVADEISVQKVDGGIAVIGNYNTPVQVYNLTGSMLYNGTEGIISLPQGGVYIVRVANKTFKIAI